jgi:uncharacterized membrane protein
MRRLGLALALAIAAFIAQPGFISWHTRAVASWDLGTIVYLGLAWWLVLRADAKGTRDHALAQDQSSYLIFLFVVSASCVSIVAIGFVTGTIRELTFWPRTWHLALAVTALMSVVAADPDGIRVPLCTHLLRWCPQRGRRAGRPPVSGQASA